MSSTNDTKNNRVLILRILNLKYLTIRISKIKYLNQILDHWVDNYITTNSNVINDVEVVTFEAHQI